jgi:hypothetical protein
MSYTEHNDTHSRAVFKAFESRLKPLLADVAPDWLLHHMELQRRIEHDTMDERVEIRLVIKPVGSARFASDRPELRAPQRLLSAKVDP